MCLKRIVLSSSVLDAKARRNAKSAARGGIAATAGAVDRAEASVTAVTR